MKQNYFLMFFIILGVQLLICNYFYISPYITLSLLPCIILLLPTRTVSYTHLTLPTTSRV